MKRLIPIVALLASGCHFNTAAEAREAGPAVDRSYPVGAFDRIAVAGPYDVTVRTGGQPGVTAHGGKAVLAETEIVVEDGVLKIRPLKTNGWNWGWNHHGRVSIAVTAATLRGAALAGSGDLRIDRIAGGDFKGEVAGSGDLSVASLAAGAVQLSIAGSGDIAAAGTAQKLDLNIAGSGDIDASKLQAAEASVSIAGSGNVRAHATASADVSVMGSGDVELTGGAKCSVSKHGSGDVRCS